MLSQSFEKVTILFLNTMDFSTVVNRAEPADVIFFVNSTVSVYDNIVASFDKVNKIETKADGSYMVVTGLDTERKMSVSSVTRSVRSASSSSSSSSSLLLDYFCYFNVVSVQLENARGGGERGGEARVSRVQPGRVDMRRGARDRRQQPQADQPDQRRGDEDQVRLSHGQHRRRHRRPLQHPVLLVRRRGQHSLAHVQQQHGNQKYY